MKEIVFFNFFQSVTISEHNPNCLNIKLTDESKILFYQKEEINFREKCLKKLTNSSIVEKQAVFTKIDKNIKLVRGKRIKKFIELLSQYKSKGMLFIHFIELKFILGLAYYTDEERAITGAYKGQSLFKGLDYDIKDRYPQFSRFKVNFLDKAIKSINENDKVEIKGLKLNKIDKIGLKVSLLTFTFDKIKERSLTNDEIHCFKYFTGYGLNESQVKWLIRQVGHKEMYGRLMHYVEEKNNIFYERESNARILDLGAYLYKNIFIELQ